MSQEINLNVSPYFDDFDKDKNYYKVLFKPGYPVQSRELTTLQSILQNQIEQFGNHIFKEGSVVIPGQINYINNFYAVEIQSQYLGIDVRAYLTALKGKTIRGRNTGVRASVLEVLSSSESSRGNNTLYLNFLDSDYLTGSYQSFADDEVLIIEDGIYQINELDESKTVIVQAGDGFAVTIPINCNSIGSAVNLSEGIYFLRGYFVNVPTQTLILDQYSNTPSYRVGLQILEDTVNSDDDETLNDNAQGFSNYSAPGADRLSIEAVLTAIPTGTYDVENFVQLLEVRDGILKTIQENPQYSVLSQELARRTYEESGDYYVVPPSVTIKETLNDFKGNEGIFEEGQVTYNNNTPSENLATYKISPFKAYVRGYEVSTISPTFLDFEKPRTKKSLEDQSLNYVTGPTFTVNRVYGAPSLGVSTTFTVRLNHRRIGPNSGISSGKEIGLARVYDFALETGSYNTSNPNLNEWDISLYDIQTYTEIFLNEPISLTTPTHIKGKSSGAVGFLRFDAANSGIITAYSTKGNFISGENLIFDGIENSRVSTSVIQYNSSDIRSIFGVVGAAGTFNADVKQTTLSEVGQVNITPGSSGMSTVTSTTFNFVGVATHGCIVSYTNPGISTVSFARVRTVSQYSLILEPLQNVVGVCHGDLPTSSLNPADFKILTSKFQASSDNTLFTTFPKKYISDVDLNDSQLVIRKEFDITISSNQSNTITAGTNESFLPFDEERYVLTLSNGTTEPLSSDKFVFTNSSKELTLIGLSANTTGKLISTLRKTNIKAKTKNKKRVNILPINRSKYSYSGIGQTTVNDGLVFGTYPYGTRVQDEDICLLKADVTKLYGVFESDDINGAELPNIVLTSLTGPTAKTGDLLVGEEFVGTNSGAIGIYCEKVNDLKINYVSLNDRVFEEGEVLSFKDSGVSAVIQTLGSGDNNITNSFVLDNGHRNTIYDYGRIIRTPGRLEPSRSLKIVFETAEYSSSDTGDITTAGSYDQFNYCDIPSITGIRNSDILDIRPRVSEFSVGTSSLSPLEFRGRTFSSTSNSATNILASDESINLSYSYYLPRIDRLFLTKDGVFQLNKGEPSDNPQLPPNLNDAIEISRVFLSPYLCDLKKLDVNLLEYKRYRMSDISKLEGRIKNLELYTTLSLLETDTANLPIKDNTGLIRFKSGFFVDDFSSTKSQRKETIVKNSIDISNGELRPAPYTNQIDLLIGSTSTVGVNGSIDPSVDIRYVSDLLGSGVKKTGQVLTLNYTEVEEISQPYATREEKVSPVRSAFYGGTIELTPSSDVWVDQVKVLPRKSKFDGDYTETQNQLNAKDLDKQSGFNPVVWGSWDTMWSGVQKKVSENDLLSNYDLTNEYIKSTSRSGSITRQGVRKIVKELLDDVSIGDSSITTQIVPFIRSRNVEFVGKRLKPYTRMYGFFDGQAFDRYIVPKLIEIEMVSGTFSVGETVIGTMPYGNDKNSPKITFRVSQQNHKFGPYNNPTETYATNPYVRDQIIPSAYSQTSTLLNVDTFSLSQQSQGNFFGYIRSGMVLRGQTTKAEAKIVSVRLVSDNTGVAIGSFFIPDPNVASNPSFDAGNKVFKLTSNSINSQTSAVPLTSAEEKYYALGKISSSQDNLISVRLSRYESQNQVDSILNSSNSTSTVVSSTVLGSGSPSQTPLTSSTTSQTQGSLGIQGIQGSQNNQFVSGIQGNSTSVGSITPTGSPSAPSSVAPPAAS